MLRPLAKIISTVGHPLMLPIYMILYIIYGNTLCSLLPDAYKFATVMYVGIGASIFPMFIIAIFVGTKMVRNIEMPEHGDRAIPLFLSFISVALTLYFINSSVVFPAFVIGMVAGECAILLLAAVISLFWKISLHMLGMGALFGFMFIVGYLSHVDFSQEMQVVAAASGVVAWARLYLESHNLAQLFVGYIVGAVVMSSAMVVTLVGMFV